MKFTPETALLACLCLSLPAAAMQGGKAQKTNKKPTGLEVAEPTTIDPVSLRDATNAAGLAEIFTVSPNQHSGGVAWVDYNGDYWPDLFITNGSGRPHRLFRNNGDGTFSNVTALITKTDLNAEEAGAYFADVDNDGDSDIFIPVDNPTFTGTVVGGPNMFYRNDGGTFTEMAAGFGVLDPDGRRSITAGFADFDRDGLVDLYVGKWGVPVRPLDFYDALYQNVGGTSFTDVASTKGMMGYGRNNLVCLWFDANLDGWIDFYQGNVGEFAGGFVEPENHDVFFVSDGTGTLFTDNTSLSPGIGDDATAAMGMDVGDIDNDGDWDLYITDNPVEGAAPFGNVLYLGDGTGGFEDNQCVEAGVCLIEASWPCNFVDFNRDGWVDLWVGSTFAACDDALFINQQDGTFENMQQAVFTGNECRGGSCADYDGDGDVDIMMWRSSQVVRLVENVGLDSNQWVSMRLFGTVSNRDAIGATVRVTVAGVTQMRRVSGGDSAHSQSEQILHFGLGSGAACDVSVTWPNGGVQNFSNVTPNEIYFIDETAGILTESLISTAARWSTSTQVMDITADSNFGGRTDLTVLGYGALQWQPIDGDFKGRFSGVASAPGTITVQARRGSQFVIPVTVVP